MSAGKNRGGRPRGALGPEGVRELASLEIVDAAAELEAVDAMLVHVLRRIRVRRAHMAAVYRAHTGPAATPLADIIQLPASSDRGPEPSQPHHAMAA